MTASVRILTTTSMDSSPSILLIAPDGSRILIDCGEGCQRSFLEYRERLASVRAVCITHLSAKSLGGLPGMILTSANSRNQSAAIATATATATATFINSSNNNNHSKNDDDDDDDENKTESSLSLDEQQLLDLTVVGPVGMKDFMHALRHFVFCEHFRIQTREGGDVCDLEIIGKQQQQQQQQQKQQKQQQETSATSNKKGNTQKIKKQKGSSDAFMNFFFTSLAFDYERPLRTAPLLAATSADTTTSPSTTTTTASILSLSQQTISYLFTTPPIPGKFEIEKATALGIPKGPLFTQLKAGKTVSFIHPETGQQQLVHSHQVVTPTTPGIAVLVLRYPPSPINSSRKAKNVDDKKNELGLLERLFQTLNLPDLLRSKDVHLELILHLCTQSDFESEAAVAWRKSLHAFNGNKSGVRRADGNVDIVDDAGIIQHVLVDTEPETDLNGPPHLGATVMAQTRATLSSDIYLTLFSSTTTTSSCTSSSTEMDAESRDEEMMPVVAMESTEKSKVQANNTHVTNGKGSSRSSSNGADNVVFARPTLEYILLPRSKRGIVAEQVSGKDVEQQEDIEKAKKFANESGAKTLAESVLSECGDTTCSPLSSSLEGSNINNTCMMGQLIFAGTASAIPCKYRNVTGMCLTDKFGRNMLLDIGEGTIGQLLRVHHHHHDRTMQSLLSSITAVWISHPHADHHLGILRFLEERQHQLQSMPMSIDPVVIIAPPPIFDFLREYSMIVPSIANSYHAIDCGDFLCSRMKDNADALPKLQSVFQVTCCRSVQVQHCPFSYAVILEGTSFGTLAYSGDCRPSHELAKEAHGADVLIHEATFEDGMEAEAALKRHCTVGEALRVAQEMQAKCLVLTHFSQRYPKIPPTPATLSSIPIIFAFDFMRLTPQNLLAASKLTPALRLLYSSDGDDDDVEAAIDGGPSEAEVALSVPGLFAQSYLL